MFVHVSLLRPQRGDFFLTYAVSKEQQQNPPQKGDIVEIPFRNTREQGVVFYVSKEQPEFSTKTIGKILQQQFFSEHFLEYIQDISDYFFCPPSFFLSKTAPVSLLTTKTHPPQEKQYLTKKSPEEIITIKGKKQQELCTFLFHENSLVAEGVVKKNFSNTVIQSALQKKYIEAVLCEKYSFQPVSSVEKEQYLSPKRFFDLSDLDLHNKKNIILGSNHSSKNAVLAQSITNTIAQNKQTLFVFPDEISLTQAFQKFEKLFPPQWIEKYSSGMGKSQKENLFWKLKSGHTKILLGTKNTLFFPFQNLGQIILHEYHNPLYTTQIFPFTHAKDIAKKRSTQEAIPLFFSANTGDIEEIFLSTSSEDPAKISIFSTPPSQQTHISVVDMNLERTNGNTTSISGYLEQELLKNLQNKKQSILFLNRKGMFSTLYCKECGWVPLSPLSGNKMGVFKDSFGKKVLRCTTSRHQEIFPNKCPQCNNTTLLEMGKGTQEIEETLRVKFPNANIFRADKDSLSSGKKTKDFLAKTHLPNSDPNKIDIIIATQIILQSFPFPQVSLVCNVMTENDILFPSFRAEEKGFIRNMKLFESIGNISENTQVILQTFCPQHPFLQKIQHQDFQKFFQEEISQRKFLQYPPFSQSIEIRKKGKKKDVLEKNISQIQNDISKFCIKTFPIEITYHPQRNIFTAKLVCFVEKNTDFEGKFREYVREKNLECNRYAD